MCKHTRAHHRPLHLHACRARHEDAQARQSLRLHLYCQIRLVDRLRNCSLVDEVIGNGHNPSSNTVWLTDWLNQIEQHFDDSAIKRLSKRIRSSPGGQCWRRLWLRIARGTWRVLGLEVPEQLILPPRIFRQRGVDVVQLRRVVLRVKGNQPLARRSGSRSCRRCRCRTSSMIRSEQHLVELLRRLQHIGIRAAVHTLHP